MLFSTALDAYMFAWYAGNLSDDREPAQMMLPPKMPF